MTTEQGKNQRSFDMAAVALVKQGKPSAVSNGRSGVTCQYRGPDGTRCAAGWLFEGEVGKDFEEGASCVEDRVSELLRANGHDPDFALCLQRAHDIVAAHPNWVPAWSTEMHRVAKEWALSTEVLDAALATRAATSNV